MGKKWKCPKCGEGTGWYEYCEAHVTTVYNEDREQTEENISRGQLLEIRCEENNCLLEPRDVQ